MSKKVDQLEQLGLLIGEWKMESIADDKAVASGQTTLAWLAGKSYIIQHTVADPPLPTTPKVWIDNSPFPIVAIISQDDSSGRLYYNYADGRGVHRVYMMSFKDNVWKTWGQAGPGFYQRMTSTFSKDVRKIDTLIEQSKDNKTWQTDFRQIYTRLS